MAHISYAYLPFESCLIFTDLPMPVVRLEAARCVRSSSHGRFNRPYMGRRTCLVHAIDLSPGTRTFICVLLSTLSVVRLAKSHMQTVVPDRACQNTRSLGTCMFIYLFHDLIDAVFRIFYLQRRIFSRTPAPSAMHLLPGEYGTVLALVHGHVRPNTTIYKGAYHGFYLALRHRRLSHNASPH